MKIIDVPKQILELLTRSEAESTWGTPEPIEAPDVPVLPLTMDMLPNSLAPWIKDGALRMQAPIDYVASTVVVMLGSIIGTGCAVRPKQRDNWTEVPNLWGAVVGRPGQMKSPSISEGLKPLYRLDGIAQRDHELSMSRFMQEQLMNKVAMDVLSKRIKADKTLNVNNPSKELTELARRKGLPDEPPAPKRYYSNDCTLEALGAMLEVNPRGIMTCHDELTGFMAGFDRPGREGERQGYLTAWNGQGSLHVDRIGRGQVFIPRFCATVFGGIQPDKLEAFLAETQNSYGNDGFIQRLQVLVYPDEIPVGKVVDEVPDQAAADAAFAIVSKLADQLDTFGATQDTPDELPYFRFEKVKAQKAFFDWLESHQRRIEAEEASIIQEHLGKYRKLVPALALIFHLVEIAAGKIKPGTQITLSSLNKALLWARYLESHARRVYGMATNHKVQAASLLASKITSNQLADGFNSRDIVRKGWTRLTESDQVKAACDELEAANWIRRKKVDGPKIGRTPLPTYEINPAVFNFSNARGCRQN